MIKSKQIWKCNSQVPRNKKSPRIPTNKTITINKSYKRRISKGDKQMINKCNKKMQAKGKRKQNQITKALLA